MSGIDEVGKYYRDSLTLWGSSFTPGAGANSTAWHFGFPRAFPSRQLRCYGWGFLHQFASPANNIHGTAAFNGWTSTAYWEPSTEEFFGATQTRNPIAFAHLASSDTRFVGCDIYGRIWCAGIGTVPAFIAGERRFSCFGLDDDLYPDPTGVGFATRVVRVERGDRQASFVPVYGDNGDILNYRFVKVGTTNAFVLALTDSNELYVAGRILSSIGINNIFESSFGTPVDTDATDVPDYDLRFFRRVRITEVIDENMNRVTLATPLAIKNFFMQNGPSVFGTSNSIIVQTTDDDLYIMSGPTAIASLTITNTFSFTKISGFVKTVQLTNGGSGYTSNPTITVSAPSSAQGTTAQFEILRSGGSITDIRIRSPGSGYGTTPPTITFTGGGGSGATATCEIFDGKWKTACGGLLPAAICENGELYTWGRSSLWGVDTSVWFPALLPQDTQLFNRESTTIVGSGGSRSVDGYAFPVKAWNPSGKTYERVVASRHSASAFVSHGVLLSADGSVSYWGAKHDGLNSTPDLADDFAHYPRPLSSVTTIGDKTFIDIDCSSEHVVLLDEDGIAYTYGRSNRPTLGQGFSPAPTGAIAAVSGNATWSAVFAGSICTLAIRNEEFDSYGNRINPLPPVSPA